MESSQRRRRVEPTDEWEQVELLCGWPEQRDYELIRPLVLFGARRTHRSLETSRPPGARCGGGPPSSTRRAWRASSVRRRAALSVSATLLGAYIVTRINFPLFFEAGTGAARLEDLLGRWALLNHARVGVVGAALVLLLLSLISATRSTRTPSARDGVQ
jgi:hypothetical protein